MLDRGQSVPSWRVNDCNRLIAEGIAIPVELSVSSVADRGLQPVCIAFA